MWILSEWIYFQKFAIQWNFNFDIKKAFVYGAKETIIGEAGCNESDNDENSLDNIRDIETIIYFIPSYYLRRQHFRDSSSYNFHEPILTLQCEFMKQIRPPDYYSNRNATSVYS